MDIQLLAIAVAIVVVVIIVVTCFLMIGNRERTFEDALAEQKGGLNILLASGHHQHENEHGAKKQHKEHQKKKKSVVAKENQKKEKTKPDEHGNENVTKELLSVHERAENPQLLAETENLQPETENADVAEENAAEQQQQQIQSQKQKKKHGKKEKIGKKIETQEDTTDGKEEFEEKVELTPENQQQPPIEEELVVETKVHHVTSSAPPTDEPETENLAPVPKKKKQKSKNAKVKQEPVEDEKVLDNEISINATMRRLHLPALTESQLDVVAEFYSNPELWSAGTMMVGGQFSDDVGLSKKLEEKESLLAQENQKLATATQNMKEMKQEVLSEKQRFSLAERGFKEQLTLLQTENQNLSQKIREFQSQMTAKMQAYRQMEAQVLQCRIEQGNAAQVQQVRDENQRFKERVSSLDQEIHSRNSELQRLKQELMNREGQIHRLEQQRQEIEQRRSLQDSTLAQQLVDSQTKFVQKEKECTELIENVNVLQNELSLLDQNHKKLKQQLTDKENRVQTLSYQTAVEGESKKELERVKSELAETLDVRNVEISKYKDLETECVKLMREHEEQMKKIFDQNENDTRKFVEEINVLRKELELLSQEKSRTEDFRYKELENALNAKNKLDADIMQLKTDLETTKNKLQERDGSVADLQKQIENLNEQKRITEQDLQKLKNTVQHNGISDEEVDVLKQQMGHLDATLNRRNATIKNLDEQLKATTSKSSDSETEICKLRKKCEELNEQVRVQQQQCNAMVNGHASEVPGVVINPELLKVNERSMAQLSKQLINKDGEIAHLKEQIDMLKKKNIELRDKNYKSTEIVQQMEKNVKELLDRTEIKYKNEISDFEKQTREKLAHCLPNTNLDMKKNFKDFIGDFEKALKSLPVLSSSIENSSKNNNDLQVQFDKLAIDNQSLQRNIENYKKVLANTEKLLSNLEKSAADDEKEWRAKYLDLEQRFNEAQSQLHSFKTLLEQEKLEREGLIKELNDRNAQLNGERNAARELGVQSVKLRGMLKTGQDALKQEQDLVKQLQNQIKNLQDDKGGRVVHEEVEELRKKLLQRENQLEREMTINKQLNNKLASLGVTTPFVSAS